jgi:DNA-binding transcriptional ArsR family regulator
MKKPASKAAAPTRSAAAQYTMKSLDQLRILAHPLRLRLLEAFASGPATTHQVAKAFGVPATRLYHHVNALERVGLIRLRETRPVRGTIEKYYEAVARRMIVGEGLLSEEGGRSRRKDEARRAGLNDVLSSVFEEARRDLIEALGRGRSTPEGLRPIALRAIVTRTPAQLAVLRTKFLRLLKASKGRAPASKRGEAKARITLVFAAEIAGESASKPTKKARKPKEGKKLP